MFKVNNKDTRTTPVFIVNFAPFSDVFIVNFEHVIVGWNNLFSSLINIYD